MDEAITRHRFASQFLVLGIDAEHVARPQRLELARRIAAPAPQVQRDRAVQQAGVHVRQAEMRGERAGDRCPCRWPPVRRRR